MDTLPLARVRAYPDVFHIVYATLSPAGLRVLHASREFFDHQTADRWCRLMRTDPRVLEANVVRAADLPPELEEVRHGA